MNKETRQQIMTRSVDGYMNEERPETTQQCTYMYEYGYAHVHVHLSLYIYSYLYITIYMHTQGTCNFLMKSIWCVVCEDLWTGAPLGLPDVLNVFTCDVWASST